MVTVFQNEALRKRNTWGIIKNQTRFPTTITLVGKITLISNGIKTNLKELNRLHNP
jgi:hypothetical protein